MRVLKVLLLVFVIAILGIGAGLYWFVVSRGFSARDKPRSLEKYIATRVRYLATPPEAKNLRNPLEPTPELIAEARDHYADHCAVCHANNGSGKTEINVGLYPPAPDMRQAGTQDLTDGEIFFIIKNGIRFTGMPGWGGEEENWKLVLFIRHLPKLTPEEIEQMNEVNRLEKDVSEEEHEHKHKH